MDPEKPVASEPQCECTSATSNPISGANSRKATPEAPSKDPDREAREQEVAKQMAMYDKCFAAAQDLFVSHHSKRLRTLLDSMAARKVQAQVLLLYTTVHAPLSHG